MRLQGGDPLVFGRAGEEMAALRAAGIEFEIVPGVTSASAAAAAAQVSLTDRQLASKLIFLSAHRCKGDFAADWASIAGRDATLAIYMPGGNYEPHRARTAAGWPARRHALRDRVAGLHAAATHTAAGTGSLSELPEPPAPALLLVGEVTRAEALEAATAWEAGGEAFASDEKETVG